MLSRFIWLSWNSYSFELISESFIRPITWISSIYREIIINRFFSLFQESPYHTGSIIWISFIVTTLLFWPSNSLLVIWSLCMLRGFPYTWRFQIYQLYHHYEITIIITHSTYYLESSGYCCSNYKFISSRNLIVVNFTGCCKIIIMVSQSISLENLIVIWRPSLLVHVTEYLLLF